MNSQGNRVHAHSEVVTGMCLSPEVGDDPKASSFNKLQGREMLAEVLVKVIRKGRSRSTVMSVLENHGACR